MISPKSLSYLSQSLQDNPYIHTLTLSSNIFLGDLSELSTSLQSSSLKHLDLSKNQLTDSQIPYIQSLLRHSALASLNLECNQFKSMNLYQCLAENSYLEDLSVSYNPLGLNEVLSVLDALVVNKSLKILGIQGFNNILIDQKLAEVLKRSLLIVLKYDLDIADLKVLKEIENSLMTSNRSLVSIESKGVDWDGISSKHPLVQIKKALKANLWLSQNEALPSDMNDEIFMDVQEVVVQKLNSEKTEEDLLPEEEEMIAMEYDRIPEILPVVHEEKPFFQDFSAVFQKFEEKFEAVLMRVTNRVEKIEDRLDIQQDELQSLKGAISGKLNKLAEQIETEVGSFTGKYKNMSQKLEEKIIQFENRDERKTTLLKEVAEQYELTQETLKDLDSKIDQLDHAFKSKPIPKQDFSITKLSSSQSEMFAQVQDLQDKILSLTSQSPKLTSLEDQLKKVIHKCDGLKQEFLSWQTEIAQNLLEIEERLSETSRFKPQISNMQKEIFSKLTALDCKILEVADSPLVQDLAFKLASTENRVSSLEEKITKGLNETVYTIKHRDQLIDSRLAYLEQERLNIEELRCKLASRNEESMRESFGEREKSLDERIATLEKFNTVKKQYGAREGFSAANLR